MLFPTLTTFSAVLLALAGSSQAIGGNAHAARPRRAQHFGRQQQQQQVEVQAQPQPPAGAKVFTTHIAKPEGYNTTHSLVDGEMVRRGEGVVDLEARGGPIGKRAFSGMRATYYAIGLGACGQYDAEPAYIVALNSAQYGGGYPGPQCFKSITITGGSRNGHAVATIKDECPTCPYGGLDMSEALFSNFASADEGVATITWWFNDDAPPPPAPTTSSAPAWTPEPVTSTTPAWTPPPSTSTEPAYTPPTTSSTPTSTSVWTPPPTTSTSSTWVAPTPSSSSSVVVSSSSTAVSSSSSSSSAVSSSASSSSFSMSSLALGKGSASNTASRTNSAGSATSTAAADSDNNNEDAYYNGATGNLEMLSDVTLQLGNMVVMSAQQAR